jgi:hypothetical protein
MRFVIRRSLTPPPFVSYHAEGRRRTSVLARLALADLRAHEAKGALQHATASAAAEGCVRTNADEVEERSQRFATGCGARSGSRG